MEASQSSNEGYDGGIGVVSGLSASVGRDQNQLCHPAALDIHDKRCLSRSNSIGRLATVCPSMAPAGADFSKFDHLDVDHEAGEETPLLPKKNTDIGTPAPSLRVWIIPALCCAATYALYNIFIKKGSFTIHPILGSVILQFVAALLGVIILICFVSRIEIQYESQGSLWSCCAGLAVGSAEMLSFCVSGMGVPATHSIPIIIGGNVLFGAILGLIMLGEKLLWHGWFGIAMLVTGIAFVATDPGDKVDESHADDKTDDAPAPTLPLIKWIAPALICAIAYALYNIFIKKGAKSINPILGAVVLQFVAAVFGMILLVVLSVKEGGTDFLNYDRKGIIWSCCAGIAVGSAEMLFFVVSSLGVPATHSIPTVIGGSVLFGAVLGVELLDETLMLHGWFGVALLIIGIGFVATDPGEKLAGQ